MTNRPTSLVELRKHKAIFDRYTDRNAYMPSPEEIRKKCLEIQSRWSAVECTKRKVQKVEHVECLRETLLVFSGRKRSLEKEV